MEWKPASRSTISTSEIFIQLAIALYKIHLIIWMKALKMFSNFYLWGKSSWLDTIIKFNR